MIVARLTTRVFDLAMMVVLARILQPMDFGLVAIAMTLVTVVEAALELPVNQALVHLPSISTPQYDTAFTLSSLRGLALSGILVLGAWPFAHFYGDIRLAWLVIVLSVGPIARGFVSPRLAEYQRLMSFWRDFTIELAGKLVGFAVGVAAALLTQSYWSIAVGTVAYPLAMALASYCLAPYRPRLSLAELPIFSGFVGWMSAGQVVSALNWQFERLLLGKLVVTSQLGLFTTASDMASIPMLALFGPILRPLLAAFSHVKAQDERLAKSYQAALRAVLTIGLPLLVGESLVAERAVLLVLDEKWLGAAHLVQWLALSLVPGLFSLPAVPLFMSLGKTKLFLQRSSVEFAVKLPILLVGAMKFGFAGVIASRCLSEAAAVGFCLVAIRSLLGLRFRDQLLGSWRAIASTLAMVPAVLLCSRQLPPTLSQGGNAIDLMAIGLVGATTYAVALHALWRLSGSPPGVEAMAVDAVGGSLGAAWRRLRHGAAKQEPSGHA